MTIRSLVCEVVMAEQEMVVVWEAVPEHPWSKLGDWAEAGFGTTSSSKSENRSKAVNLGDRAPERVVCLVFMAYA